MTETQKAIYEHILAQADYVCLKNMSAPCDCDENADWFSRFLKIKDEKERLAYQRKYKDELKRKKECCYEAPWANGPFDGTGKINPEAVLWLHQHPGRNLCKRCPSCTIFPAMAVLGKVCSHASLIQVDPESRKRKTMEEYQYAIEMAKVRQRFACSI